MNLDIMRLIDKQFLEIRFYGVRQMTWHLQNEGHAVNCKRIRRLMRLMRLMPIDQKPGAARSAAPAAGERLAQGDGSAARDCSPAVLAAIWLGDPRMMPAKWRGFLPPNWR